TAMTVCPAGQGIEAELSDALLPAGARHAIGVVRAALGAGRGSAPLACETRRLLRGVADLGAIGERETALSGDAAVERDLFQRRLGCSGLGRNGRRTFAGELRTTNDVA